MKRCPYAVLGIEKTAGPVDIRAAYRRRARDTHPDRAQGCPVEFLVVQTAYRVLMTPELRTQHDQDPMGLFDRELEAAERQAQRRRRRARVSKLYDPFPSG